MKFNMLAYRPRITSVAALTVLLFTFIGGDIDFHETYVYKSWHGWPFIYYGNNEYFIIEYTIYVIPMILNAITFALFSYMILMINSFVRKTLFPGGPETDRYVFSSRIGLYVISLIPFIFFATFLFALCEEVLLCCGPRDALELTRPIIFGHQF